MQNFGYDPLAVAVIGDGSFTGGMVYEALNNGGRSDAKQIIILNDNNEFVCFEDKD